MHDLKIDAKALSPTHQNYASKEQSLKFKYLKNQNIYLAGRTYNIPWEMKEIMTDKGPAAEAVYNLDAEHDIPFLDERVLAPKKGAMGQRKYEQIVDAAYERANKNKEENDKLRDLVRVYVKEGIIEITHDPFGETILEELDSLDTDHVDVERATNEQLLDQIIKNSDEKELDVLPPKVEEPETPPVKTEPKHRTKS